MAEQNTNMCTLCEIHFLTMVTSGRHVADKSFYQLPHYISSVFIKVNIKNVKDPKISYWNPGYNIFLGEPVFVSKPNSKAEDEGVLLVGGFNGTSKKGICVCGIILKLSNNSIQTGTSIYILFNQMTIRLRCIIRTGC